MKTRLRKDARLLALFAVLAALPLAIWACGDAGDSPGGPTGPGSKYNPNIDYPGATITTRVNPSTVSPGETFGILATFRDANGLPVEGVPLITWVDGGAGAYFSIQTDPTMTDASGNASIHLFANEWCPNDSYTFVIATQRAWSARGYAHVKVTGATAGAVTAVSVTGEAAPTVGADATYVATVTATCTYELEFQFDEMATWYTDDDLDNLYTYAWNNAGGHNVFARARCAGSTGAYTTSAGLPVTVAP